MKGTTPWRWSSNSSGISKSFAGVRALKGVSFDLKAGEVHALVGENGAGKSTLIKVITGAHSPDEGMLEVCGQLVEVNDPVRAKGLGIAAIYQQPALFPDLTVAENIALGLERPAPWRPIRWGSRRDRARRLLERIGAAIDPEAEVRSLAMPEQQLVEIARALGADAKILIMDEPSASLTDKEVDNLFRVVRDLKAHGVGIIYISHRLEELPQVADRVTALRDGSLVGTRGMSEVTRGELIRMMVGRDLSAVLPQGRGPSWGRGARREGARLQGVRRPRRHVPGARGRDARPRGIDRRGADGTGPRPVRPDPGRLGLDRAGWRAGEGQLARPGGRDGHRLRPGRPSTAWRDPRDVGGDQHHTLATLRSIANFGLLDLGKEREVATDLVARLGVKAASIDDPVGNLSGGNQQKVALARWLNADPSVLILDEPTQGVDVGAKAEIHRLMGSLAAKGMAIVMISSELPEILGMSDRIAVMHGGTIVGTLDRDGATQEAILELALGHHPTGSAVAS